MTLHRRTRRALVLWALGVLLSLGCSGTESPSPPAASMSAPVGFVNKVWKVKKSNAVTAGQIYVFLSEGTLVLASEHGTPTLGTWRSDPGGLTMVEDGVSYPTDIVRLTADEFVIRSHNPGEAVEITLVPAETDSVLR
jgi:hypothetical protein